MSAARDNAGKAHLAQLLHFLPALEELAAHCDAGRDKYPDAAPGKPNWTLGGKPDEEYLDAAVRHIAAIVRGERIDPETGTLHASAVAWNMLALVTLNYSSEAPDAGTRLSFNGEEGRLFLPTDPDNEFMVWLSSSSGKKARMTARQWEQAMDDGAAALLDPEIRE